VTPPLTAGTGVVLIGPRAAGKTTLGKALAARLAWPFRDGDEELARAVGEPAGAHLARVGERAFRAVEEQTTLELLAEMARRPPQVLALGGGAVLSATVQERLASGPMTVVLVVAEPETLARRIAASPILRPSLTELPPIAEVEAVSRARMPVYERLARLVVDTTRTELVACCESVLARLGHSGR